MDRRPNPYKILVVTFRAAVILSLILLAFGVFGFGLDTGSLGEFLDSARRPIELFITRFFIPLFGVVFVALGIKVLLPGDDVPLRQRTGHAIPLLLCGVWLVILSVLFFSHL